MPDERLGTTPGEGDGLPSSSSPVELTIREAIARGDFDDLPGSGQPLPDRGRDENWWIRQYVAREEGSATGFLPQSLLLRREAETLQERVSRLTTEAKVRDAVADLNRRISDEIRMPTGGPPLAMRPLEPDAVVDRWRRDRATDRPTVPAADTSPPPSRKSFWRQLFHTPER